MEIAAEFLSDADMATVREKMLRLLAEREVLSSSTSFIGYGLQAVLLRASAPMPKILCWVSFVAACEAVCGVLAWRLSKAGGNPYVQNLLLSALQCSLFFSGLTWGSVLVFPGLVQPDPLLMMNALVLAVVSIISIHNLCFHRGCMLGFGLGLAVPVAITGLCEHQHVALSGAAVALLFMAQIYGRNTNRLVTQVITANVVQKAMSQRLEESNSELIEALARIEKLASTDPLTQCLNRRALLEAMDRERSRSERDGTRFGLMMFDLDYFKSINDTHGHSGGDAVLVSTANLLRRQLRPTDHLGRWGGEEFLCLVSDVSFDELRRKAEEMCASVRRSAIRIDKLDIRVTTSVGIALLCDGQTIEQVTEAADKALYAAKQSGRDRVA